ncbi:MAG: hypothetical protein P8019_01385 [Gammaproteobacteria bacterium]
MKDRLITLLGAGIAFYILLRLLFPGANLGIPQRPVSYPTSADHGKYGLAGLYRWLKTQHVPVYSLRQRYSALGKDSELTATGNLLIISLPLRMNAQALEFKQLQDWIQRGNNALLLVSMSDWPEWANRRMDRSISHMLNGFDLGVTSTDKLSSAPHEQKNTVNQLATEASRLDKLLHPEQSPRRLIPASQDPFTRGIHDVKASWLNSEGLNWHLTCYKQPVSSQVLLRDQANLSPALWLSIYGKGRLIVSRHSALFDNATLGQADNARLMSNLVYQLLGRHGTVIFDDMHQGLSAIYNPHAFFRDPRLHHTLLFLLVLWLIYVMGHSNRFGQVRQKIPQLQLREHVEAVGNLFARRLHSSAIALRHARHFFNEVRLAYGLPLNGQPVWEQLQQNTAIEPAVLRQAQEHYQRAVRHKRVNLNSFVNALKTMRRELR